MRKILLLIIALHVTLFANPKNLDDLIGIALKNNIDIQIANANIEAKKAALDYESASYLPQVSVEGELAQYYIKNDTYKDDDQVIGGKASIDQLIYDFGGTSSKISAAQSDYNASVKQLDSSTELVIINVKEAYYKILNKSQLINVSSEAVKIDELQLDQASEYFKAGVRTRIDVTNAQLQLSNSKLDLLKGEFALESEITNLISILGIKLEKNFSVQKDGTDIVSLAKQIVPMNEDKDKLTEKALKDRSEIALYKANVSVAQAAVSAARSGYYPKIFLNATYNEKSTDLISLNNRQISGGVYVKWDIFTGFSSEAKVKEYLAKLTRSKADLRDVQLQITQEVINAYLEVKKSEDSTKMQLLSVDLATQNLSLAQQRYQAGLSDMIELNDAKLGYTKSKGDLVDTYYGYLLSIAKLNYVTAKR